MVQILDLSIYLCPTKAIYICFLKNGILNEENEL